MKKLVVLISLLFFINNTYAQKSVLGAGLGFSTYYGDLSSDILQNDLKQSHPAIQLFYSYYINQYLNLKFDLGYGNVSGDDSYSSRDWQKERNLSFKSSVTEVSAIAEINFLGIKHKINPFLFFGVNMFHFNPKAYYNGQWIELQPLGTEGQGTYLYPDRKKYSLYEYSIIFGGGVKMQINQSVMLSFELGWRKTNTDYLDDVSKDYAGYEELKNTNGELAAELADRTDEYNGFDPATRIPGTQRGGEKVKDYYTMSFVNFIYILDKANLFKRRNKVVCPKF